MQVDPNITKGKQAEPAKQPEDSGGYDNFKDDNNNGVDDRYEKAEKGKVIIPAFSVGRTQHLVYLLNQLW